MKEVKFRIIETLTHQVLIEKEFDDDEQLPSIGIAFHLEGVKVKMTMGFKNEHLQGEAFESFSEETANKFIGQIKKQFEDLTINL